MLVTIGNWSLQKAAEPATDKLFPIRLVANRLRPDREDEEILPEAFNKATVDNFLANGVIDWHHLTVLGESADIRAGAFIGRPTRFAWEEGLPVVYGNLVKAHPIVRNSIIPHLEAGMDTFCSSIGGGVFKAQKVFDPSLGREKRQIARINWDHIAIAGRNHVVSPGSDVSMVKAFGGPLAAAAQVPLLNFGDIDMFVAGIQDTLQKALEAGTQTDSAQLTGFQALQAQSLEGGVQPDLTPQAADTLVMKMLMRVQDGSVDPGRNGLITFLQSEGYQQPQAEAFVDSFLQGAPKILNGGNP